MAMWGTVAKWRVNASSRGAKALQLVLIVTIWEYRYKIARFSDFSQKAENIRFCIKFTNM